MYRSAIYGEIVSGRSIALNRGNELRGAFSIIKPRDQRSIEGRPNLSNYRYFARIGWTNQACIMDGRCNRLNFDFPIGPLPADNSAEFLN